MGEQRSQEGDVGLDSADSELDKGSQDLPPGNLVCGTMTSTLDQHGIVVGGDDGASKSISTVKPDAVPAGRAVDLDLAGIGLKAFAGIFGGDAALDGISAGGNAVLSEAELLQSRAGGNLDLRCDDIYSRNLFGDCVLDLDSGVDLDKIVPVLLVHQELCGAGIAVLDRLGQPHGVVQDSLPNVIGQILCRCNFNHLLVSALDGTVALVQVDDVSVVVTQQLNLDVLGTVQEALDKNGSVSEGRQSSTLKVSTSIGLDCLQTGGVTYSDVALLKAS